MSRLQFLRGDPGGRRGGLRPPWALPEPDFLDACTRCADCIRACPEGILHAAGGGYPAVDFGRGECTFCGACVAACTPAALVPGAQPWTAAAQIDATCLARRGVECRACADPCAPRAIRFLHAVGAVARPQLDAWACTGCGACVAVCPARAIRVARSEHASEARR